MAQSFDSRLLELVGEPSAVADKVGSLFLSGSFSVSANGVLAYRRAKCAFRINLVRQARQSSQRRSGARCKYLHRRLIAGWNASRHHPRRPKCDGPDPRNLVT